MHDKFHPHKHLLWVFVVFKKYALTEYINRRIIEVSLCTWHHTECYVNIKKNKYVLNNIWFIYVLLFQRVSMLNWKLLAE